MVTVACLEKEIDVQALIKNWVWSWLGNLVGSVAMAAAVAATGVLSANPMPTAMGMYKCHLPLAQVRV